MPVSYSGSLTYGPEPGSDLNVFSVLNYIRRYLSYRSLKKECIKAYSCENFIVVRKLHIFSLH
jgi:hypothetical protein